MINQEKLPGANDKAELTDIQLVEQIIQFRTEKKRFTDALKRTIEELYDRIKKRGVTEVNIGDQLVIAGLKSETRFDLATLKSLKQCITPDKIELTFFQVPSGKQLKALSEIGGASAKAVIASARKKYETDTPVLRIKKPRKPTQRKKRNA